MASNLGVGTHEFDLDRSISEVACHCEVRNRGDESDGSRNVMENAVLPRNHKTQTHEDQGRESPGEAPNISFMLQRSGKQGKTT